jgi:hypothetical protein
MAVLLILVSLMLQENFQGFSLILTLTLINLGARHADLASFSGC